jgi:hypothetical protein
MRGATEEIARMRSEGLVLLGMFAIAVAGCGGGSSKDHATTAAVSSVATQQTGTTTANGGCTPNHPIPYDQLPPVTKAEVDRVRAAWAHKYPTAADAMKVGWWKSTPSLYGIGAHYIKDVKGLSVAAPFDLLHPPILLYDGEGPDAKFAGLSYVVAGDVEGFTGCYDVWHSHPSACIDSKGRITLTEKGSRLWYSESQCIAHGGRVMKLVADEMIHVWIGTGYTDAPIFAHDNPKLYDGYYPKQST